jgi:hypothetical protein
MATLDFQKYKIPAFWDDEFKRLDYVQEQFNDPDKLQEWHDMGFKNVATGYMCDMRSPQPKWNSKVVAIFKEMGWQNIGTSYYRMTPGTILPNHSDLYKKYVKLFNLQGREHTIRRAVIFLEDWSSGHYSECANRPVVDWRAGDVIEWSYDTPHVAANVGYADRYTLQITGHV